MKKILYYLSMVLIWVSILFVLALLALAIGVFDMLVSLEYSLGRACGHPQLWIISFGLTLLFRPLLYRSIMKEEKRFNKDKAIGALIVGVVLLFIAGILLRMVEAIVALG